MKTIAQIGTSLSTFFILAVAQANDPFGTGNVNIDGTTKGDFKNVAVNYINYFLSFLGLVAVSMIIYAGVLLVTAQGEEEQINKGKKIILWAVIGIVVIMLSFVIVRAIAGAGNAAGAVA